MIRASLAEQRALIISGAWALLPTAARAPRGAICAWLGLSALGAASKERAGSYVDRARLSIGGANRADEFLAQRVDDRGLARVVARAAEGRLQAARETHGPEEVALARPHLLLMLEHCERAASAAAVGQTELYADHTGASRDKDELYRRVLRQLDGSLPARP